MLLRLLQEKYKFACGYPEAIEKEIRAILAKDEQKTEHKTSPWRR